MRCDGNTEPSIGAGDTGQVASILRPTATVEAYAAESCFDRPEMRRGCAVSADVETEVARRAAEVGLLTLSARAVSVRVIATACIALVSGLAPTSAFAGFASRA